MTALNPCPKCGQAPSLEVKSYPEEGQSWYRIFCRHCTACSPYVDTEEEARATWDAYGLAPCPLCGRVPSIWKTCGGYAVGCKTERCPNDFGVEELEFGDLFSSWRDRVEAMTVPEENCLNCGHRTDYDLAEFACFRVGHRFRVPPNLNCPAWCDADSEEPAPAPCPVCGSSKVVFESMFNGPTPPGGLYGRWACTECGISLVDNDLGTGWNNLPRGEVVQ